MTTFPLESFLGDLEFLINTDSGSADIEGAVALTENNR